MSGREIARQAGVSKSGVNAFISAFNDCDDLQYPLPTGITNYGIAELVYGSIPGNGGRNENIELPNYQEVAKLMSTRKNMTLVFLWNRYKQNCQTEEKQFYQYSQFCEPYSQWCEENYETAHFDAVIAQKMEVDFAGQTFRMVDPLTGEIYTFIVFSLEQFNKDLWNELGKLNKAPFKKKEHNRYYYWEEEKNELMPLPSTYYEYMERKTATVSSDFHIRFDNAYYSG